MPSSTKPLPARPVENDAQAHLNGSPSSPLTITHRTSSAGKSSKHTTTRPRRDSGCAPDSARRTVKQERNTSTTPPLPKAAVSTSPLAPITKPHTLLSPDDFDDFTLDLARSPSIQHLLHAPFTPSPTTTTTSTISLSALRDTSPLFRSFCICSLDIPGFPIQYRSRHFTLSPRGLRVGDCEFLNLQGMGSGGEGGEAKEGINLTVRTGVDGRPMFVIECVGALYAVDAELDDEGGGRAEVEAAAYVFASQIDVTLRIRALAAAVLNARQEARDRRITAEEEEEEKKRIIMEETKRSNVQAHGKKKKQQQQEQNKKKQNQHVRWVKESLLVHPRHQSHAPPAVADEYSRYFSASDESDADEIADKTEDEDEDTRDASRSSPSTSATRSSSSNTKRVSLTSLPNTTFLHYGPQSGSARTAASKRPSQPRPSNTTRATPHAKADANVDIWLAESFASSRLTDPGYPILPGSQASSSSSSSPSPSSPTSILATQHLSSLLTTLRLLHRECFVLKRQVGRTTRSMSKKGWLLNYMSSALIAESASKELVTHAVWTLGAALNGERDVRVFVPWGESGNDAEERREIGKKAKGKSKHGKWIYAVPMVRGRAGEGPEVEKSWMCFVVGGNVGDLWNVTAV